MDSRRISFGFDMVFELFQYRIAKEFDAVAHRQTLVYRTNRMPVSNKSWSALSSVEDYNALLTQARVSLDKETKKFQLATSKNKADAKRAKDRGREHVPKPVKEVQEYVITLRDKAQEEDNKKTKKVSLSR